MKKNQTDLLADVARYYSSKLDQHGETPHGVDWNGEESQVLRFEQLSKIVSTQNRFTINDLGCGYGAYYSYLAAQHKAFYYEGIDVSKKMIAAAMQRYVDKTNVNFIVSGEPEKVADFGIASGIFNVRMGRSDDEWWAYLAITLEALDRTSRLGFSFNCLTSYSDANKKRDYLYYADPCKIFDLCKRRYSRNVALVHDYDLYEFTILVRKQS